MAAFDHLIARQSMRPSPSSSLKRTLKTLSLHPTPTSTQQVVKRRRTGLRSSHICVVSLADMATCVSADIDRAPSPSASRAASPSLSFVTARSRSSSPAASSEGYGERASRRPSNATDTSLDSIGSEEDASDDDAQYARPFMNPWAEVESGWRKMHGTPSPTLRQTSHRKSLAGSPLAATVPRLSSVFANGPLTSSIPTKTSFGDDELLILPTPPLSSMKTTPTKREFNNVPMQDISASSKTSSPSVSVNPPSPAVAYSNPFAAGPAFPLHLNDKPPASPTINSFLASAPVGLKARRGSSKPLSLKVPIVTPDLNHSLMSTRPDDDDDHGDLSETRSLPPSPRVVDAEKMGVKRDVMLGMKANLSGGLSMKRRTSIPRLSLVGNGGIRLSEAAQISKLSVSREEDDTSVNRTSPSKSSVAPLRLLGRSMERMAATPLKFSFDPVAAEGGRRELLSSQVGVGGKGHIEMPEEVEGEISEEYPYERGPREVLPGLYLGSEPNARDAGLLREMGFGYILNVAKEVDCPWLEDLVDNNVFEVEDILSPLVRSSSMRVTSTTPSSKRPLSIHGTAVPKRSNPKSPTNTAGPCSAEPVEHQGGSGATLGPNVRALLIRPTASTPNLKTSFLNTTSRADSTFSPTDTSSSLSTTKTTRRRSSRKRTSELAVLKNGGALDRIFPENDETGRPELRYMKLPWGHDQDGLPQEFVKAFEMIDEARAKGSHVLVHCQCGVSRSATLVIGYVMHAAAKGLEKSNVLEGVRGMHDAYSFVKEKSPWAGPNMGLIYQLIEYEKILSGKVDEDDDDMQGLPNSINTEQLSPARSENSQESAPDSTPHTPDTRDSTDVKINNMSPVDQAWDALHGIRRPFDGSPALDGLVHDVVANRRDDVIEELSPLPVFMKQSASALSLSTSDVKELSPALSITTSPIIMSPALSKASRRNSSIQMLINPSSQRQPHSFFPLATTTTTTPTATSFSFNSDNSTCSPSSSSTTTTPTTAKTTQLSINTTMGLGFQEKTMSTPQSGMLQESQPQQQAHNKMLLRASVGPGILVASTTVESSSTKRPISSSRKTLFGISCQTPTERRAAHRRAFSMDVSTFWKPIVSTTTTTTTTTSQNGGNFVVTSPLNHGFGVELKSVAFQSSKSASGGGNGRDEVA